MCKEADNIPNQLLTAIGEVAMEALNSALATVPQNNYPSLVDAISRIDDITGTPVFDSLLYSEYQTRDKVMMVKEKRVSYEQ